MKSKIFIFILSAIIVHFIFSLYTNLHYYTEPFQPQFWKHKYNHSQWVPEPDCVRSSPTINPETCVWDDNWYSLNKEDAERTFIEERRQEIGDDALYTYAGWEYIHGADPTLINAETPPLGKYLIGLSILIFNNQNIFAVISGFLVLVSLFFLNMQLFKDKLLAIIPVGIFSIEPLFYSQLQTTYIDLLYLGWLILMFQSVLRKNYILTGIFLGAMIATKSSLSTLMIVTVSIGIYLLVFRRINEIKKFTISLAIAAVVFLLSYSMYFIHGHSLVEFARVQKYVINFYASGAHSNFDVWEILLSGNWYTWWGTYVRVTEWTILWPISSLFLFIYWFLFITKKIKKNSFLLIAIWLTVYILFLSSIPTWPRYLLLFLPFMYNLAVWVISIKISPRLPQFR